MREKIIDWLLIMWVTYAIGAVGHVLYQDIKYEKASHECTTIPLKVESK